MFKSVVLALALFASPVSSVGPHHDALEHYTFADYVKDFHKVYSNDELKEREEIFIKRRDAIIAHNKLKTTWTENVNDLTDMTPAEKEARRGIDKALMFKSRSLTTGRRPKPPTEYPTSVDWRDVPNVVTSVKNQGHCGSCWTFAATEALESHIAIQTGLLFTLSEQEFASCVLNPNQCGGTGVCEGATMELAYQYAMDNGLVTEWTTPYISYDGKDFDCTLTDDTPARVATISGYTTVTTNSYDELMDAIVNVGPIGITVDASQWSSYSGGVFDGCNQDDPDLDHGVLLVGYGTDDELGDYWLVRNSWGPAWGEKGYIRLARTSDEAGRCGVDTNPEDGVGCLDGPANATVCGTCGILYDASYPTGGALA
jgi:cathepsin L